MICRGRTNHFGDGMKSLGINYRKRDESVKGTNYGLKLIDKFEKMDTGETIDLDMHHSKAYRFYVIEPDDSVSLNSIIESRDAIFDENLFSSIPRPKDIIPNLYLVEGSRDQKEAIDDEIGSIMENNTWILSDLPQGFSQKEGIVYFDTYAPVARINTIRLLLALAAIHNLVIHQMDVKTAFLNGDLDEELYMKQPEGFVMPDQLEYSRAIRCLMYVMTSTRPDIAYVVGRLNSSSTSGWVFLLGGGTISWATKKQTCITGSTMESKFVALAAEWLRNLIHEIPIWSKPIAPISIRCDSALKLLNGYIEKCRQGMTKRDHLCEHEV
ncbi:zinc finger, CCHC-type containing protein [Tanacetum coccineum]